MNMFSTRKSEAPPSPPPVTSSQPNGASVSGARGGLLSRGVSIKGSVKLTGSLTVGEHASIRVEIRAKSVKVRGRVEGDIFATERCELQAGCALQGDIEAPRLIVDENATFLGSAKVTPKS